MKKSKYNWQYFIHVAIGLFFMLIFPLFPAKEPLTTTGMSVLGILIGMVYLWSTVNAIWPSLLGLVLIAYSGLLPDFSGYDALKYVFMNSFGLETVLFVWFGMILFAAIEYVGCTDYIVRFFMRIKALNGRPYLFFFILFVATYFLSAVCDPLGPLLIMWPIVVALCQKFGYKKDDKIFYTLVCGIYLSATLGQPLLPFKGAQYAITSTYNALTDSTVNYGSYIVFNLIMGILLLALFVVIIRFVLRPDVEGFRSISTEHLVNDELPPMNLQQKLTLITVLFFVVALLAANLLPATLPGVGFLKNIGVLGITVILIVILMIIPYKDGHMLDFQGIARKSFNWGVAIMVPAAVYICSSVTAEATGIKPWIVQILNPLLGGKPAALFIILVLFIALALTNVGNNNGMAMIVMPVVLAFTDQYAGVSSYALCMCVASIVFVALLTPAASPFCSVLHAQKNLVSFKQILYTFLPMFFTAIIVYVVLGYPLATLLFR